jgi:pimeloyl-ACP methyl ester carboxylesterase
VASYDRGGLGWSERCRRPRTLEQITRELESLLRAAEIGPPYVLVGHSFGGLVIRAFAHERPDQVAGLVFVDPVSIETWARCSETDRRRLAIAAKLSRRGAWLARLGVVRFALAAATRGTQITASIARASAGRATPFLGRLVGEIRKLPADSLPMVKSQWSRAKGFEAMAEYLEALPDCATSARNLSIPSEIPLIVLSAGSATEPEIRERERWVQESKRGRHLRVENTGHWLHLERPEAVIAAVKELVEAHQRITSGAAEAERY